MLSLSCVELDNGLAKCKNIRKCRDLRIKLGKSLKISDSGIGGKTTITLYIVYPCLGYKRISKIRPNTEFRPEFGFLFNRTEPSFQNFGFGLTKTEIRGKNSVSTEFCVFYY